MKTDGPKILGRVVRGTRYGAKLGFPTANLDRRQLSRLTPRPKLGVYAGSAQIKNSLKKYKAGIVIGPLDRRGLPKIEAHLINFSGNLYGKNLELRLIKYLRPFRKYKTEPELIKMIQKDVKIIKKIIKTKSPFVLKKIL